MYLEFFSTVDKALVTVGTIEEIRLDNIFN